MSIIFVSHFFTFLSLALSVFALSQDKDEKFFNYSILSWLFFIVNLGIQSDINGMMISFYFMMTIFLARDNYRHHYLMLSSIAVLWGVYSLDTANYFDLYKTLAMSFLVASMFIFRGIQLRFSLGVSYLLLLAVSVIKEDPLIIIIHGISLLAILFSIHKLKSQSAK